MALASFYFEWDSPLALIHRDKIKLQTCASYEFFVQGLKNKLGKSKFYWRIYWRIFDEFFEIFTETK